MLKLCKTGALFFLVIHPTASKYMRVVGGQEAPLREFPYVARFEAIDVKKNGNVTYALCTASVLKPTWTMTAAHCFNGFGTKHVPGQREGSRMRIINTYALPIGSSEVKYQIKYGSTIGNYSEVKRDLEIVEFPSRRDTELTYEDILLVRTAPIILKKYGKISALDYQALSGQEAITIGYGLTDSEYKAKKRDYKKFLTIKLQFTKVLIKSCEKYNKDAIYPTLCAVHACSHHSTACPGDSGGPLLHPSGIVGVASRVDNSQCSRRSSKYRSKRAGYYVPISVFIDWINEVTGKE